MIKFQELIEAMVPDKKLNWTSIHSPLALSDITRLRLSTIKDLLASFPYDFISSKFVVDDGVAINILTNDSGVAVFVQVSANKYQLICTKTFNRYTEDIYDRHALISQCVALKSMEWKYLGYVKSVQLTYGSTNPSLEALNKLFSDVTGE